MSEIAKINDNQFDAEVLNHSQLTVVEFGATWCGPCKKLHPVINELAEDFRERAKIIEMDVGDSPQTAQTYGVISVPQVLFFKNGQVVDRVVGVLPKIKLKEKIENNLNA